MVGGDELECCLNGRPTSRYCFIEVGSIMPWCVCARACVQILERHWLLRRIWPEGPRSAIRRHEIQLPSMGVRIRATRGRGRPQEFRCARVLSHIFSDPAGHCSECNQDHLPKWPASHSAAGEPTSYHFFHGFLQFISITLSSPCSHICGPRNKLHYTHGFFFVEDFVTQAIQPSPMSSIYYNKYLPSLFTINSIILHMHGFIKLGRGCSLPLE